MKIRATGVALTVFLMLGLGACQTQSTQIGVLSGGSSPSDLGNAFTDGLREHGYVEGPRLVIERRYAEGRPERLPALAAELARSAKVILAEGSDAAQAAKKAAGTIPVIAIAGDLVESELVASVARPGGNITGLSMTSRQLSARRLELLTAIVPGVSRVTVIWNPTDPAKVFDLRVTQVAAEALRLTLELVEARTVNDLEQAFANISRERTDALLVLADTFIVAHAAQLVERAAESGIPAMYEFSDFVTVGGLIAYGPSYSDTLRRAAVYADKILKGARPADLPVGEASQVKLAINLKTAKAASVTIPESVLVRADEIIQ